MNQILIADYHVIYETSPLQLRKEMDRLGKEGFRLLSIAGDPHEHSIDSALWVILERLTPAQETATP